MDLNKYNNKMNKQKEQPKEQPVRRPNWGGTLTLKGVKKDKKK